MATCAAQIIICRSVEGDLRVQKAIYRPADGILMCAEGDLPTGRRRSARAEGDLLTVRWRPDGCRR
jgi:hypothetical protein